MTAIDWILKPNVAYVATDTLRYEFGGRVFGFTSKIAVVPHLNLAIAVRGSNFHATWAYNFAREELNDGGIDAFAEAAPAALGRLHREFRDTVDAKFPGQALAVPEMLGAEYLVFGWSDRRKRMRAVLFSSLRDFGPEDMPDGMVCAPEIRIALTDAERRILAKGRAPESLIAGAEIQRRDLAGAGRGEPVMGGELVLTELRRSQITMKTVHRFDDYKEALAAMQERET